MDGKPAEIQLTGDCMVSVPLTEGKHLVEYTYRNPAFSLGWKISLLCVAVFSVLVYSREKTALIRKRGKYER